MKNSRHEEGPRLRALTDSSAAPETSGAADGVKAVQRIWTPELGQQFTPLSTYFLRNYRRLGMTSTEFELICHLISYKWKEDAPYPSLGRVAESMGKDLRYLRKVCAGLQTKGLLYRNTRIGGTTRYELGGLFKKLEELKRQDEAQEVVANAG